MFPLVFFTVNRAWMYTVQNYPDAWMYTGYFLHPDLMYPRMPFSYHGARVLHIIPGVVLFQWLPVAEAIFVYKAAMFYAVYLLLFGALRGLFRNERAALIGAVWGATQGLTIYNLSWNYATGTCLVLLLGTLWAQARMRDSKQWWLWAMLAGAFYVGAVWTYLLLAMVAPLIFALFVYGLPRWTWTDLAKGLGWAALGGVLVTLLQGLISLGMGGPFWFFVPQLLKAQSLLDEDWVQAFETWWRTAVWLPYYGLVALLAVAGIWRGGAVAYQADARWPTGKWPALAAPLPWVGLVYLVGLALFWVFNAVGIYQTLQNYAMSSFLLPFSFLVMGGWIAWLLARMPERQQWVVVVVALGGVLLVYGWLGFHWPVKWFTPGAFIFILLILAAGLAGAGRSGHAALAAALVLVGALAGLNLYLADRGQLNPRRLPVRLAFDEALYGTVRLLDPWDREGEVWFWDNYTRPRGLEDRLVSYFYNWGPSVLGEKFPGLVGGIDHPHTSLSMRNKFPIQAGTRVVLFDTTGPEMASAQAALAERGLQLKPLAKMESLAGGGFLATQMELWEAVPTRQTQGVAVDLAKAETAAGVGREAAAGTVFNYPVGETEPLWKMELPEGMSPKPGASPGLLKVRIGANERRLRLILADINGKALAEASVDPGTAVRDWWLELKPGTAYRYLEVRPKETDSKGGFVIESAEY